MYTWGQEQLSDDDDDVAQDMGYEDAAERAQDVRTKMFEHLAWVDFMGVDIEDLLEEATDLDDPINVIQDISASRMVPMSEVGRILYTRYVRVIWCRSMVVCGSYPGSVM